MKYFQEQLIWILLRLSMGWLFLWAFFDKLFGLGFSTKPNLSWVNGVSPTYYFLDKVSVGLFSPIFHQIAGLAIIDWLFMLGLLGIGASLLIGIYIKVASILGAVMVFFMWLALFPPAQNPFLDEHLVYILIFAGIYLNAKEGAFDIRNTLKKIITPKTAKY